MRTLKIKLNATPSLLHPGADIEKLNERIRCHIEIADIPDNVTNAEVLRIISNALIFNPPGKITFAELNEKTEKGLIIKQ